jgi:hypothetical protein
MLRVLLIAAIFAVVIPVLLYLLWIVHCILDRVCVGHARKFCSRHGFELQRARVAPAFDQSGVKTELTLIQLDCLDAQKQRRLVLLLVWPFGVRKMISDERYPESYDQKWPQNCT